MSKNCPKEFEMDYNLVLAQVEEILEKNPADTIVKSLMQLIDDLWNEARDEGESDGYDNGHSEGYYEAEQDFANE